MSGARSSTFDVLAGALFVDGPRHWLGQWGAPEWLSSVAADGIGSGMQTVATFIPVVGFLYLFLAVLEASGYLPPSRLRGGSRHAQVRAAGQGFRTYAHGFRLFSACFHVGSHP